MSRVTELFLQYPRSPEPKPAPFGALTQQRTGLWKSWATKLFRSAGEKPCVRRLARALHSLKPRRLPEDPNIEAENVANVMFGSI